MVTVGGQSASDAVESASPTKGVTQATPQGGTHTQQTTKATHVGPNVVTKVTTVSQQLSALRLSLHKSLDGAHGSSPGRAVSFASGCYCFKCTLKSHVAVMMFESQTKIAGPHEAPTEQLAQQIQPGLWRVSGDLSIHEWADALSRQTGLGNMPGTTAGVSTLGGFVMAQLGRLPQAGDTITAGKESCLTIRAKGDVIDSMCAGIKLK